MKEKKSLDYSDTDYQLESTKNCIYNEMNVAKWRPIISIPTRVLEKRAASFTEHCEMWNANSHNWERKLYCENIIFYIKFRFLRSFFHIFLNWRRELLSWLMWACCAVCVYYMSWESGMVTELSPSTSCTCVHILCLPHRHCECCWHSSVRLCGYVDRMWQTKWEKKKWRNISKLLCANVESF